MLGFWRKAAKFVRIGLQTIIYSIAVMITMLFLTMCLKLYFQNQQLKKYEKMLGFWRKAAKFELDYKLLKTSKVNASKLALLLIENGADYNIKNLKGDTPLLLTVNCGIGTAFPFALGARHVFVKTTSSTTPRRGLGSARTSRATAAGAGSGLGSTDSCATAVHTKPFSTSPQSSRCSVKYLLLPPRSAPTAAPDGLTPGPSALTVATPLLVGASVCNAIAFTRSFFACRQRQSISTTLKRHPFSGLVTSAGELLHTP
ncbi:hypothetical protein FQR65_LT15828 [Abscondita terminalis]|nr:hypothetical protein FQR65_LT15828 [Abscondita terminalis]